MLYNLKILQNQQCQAGKFWFVYRCHGITGGIAYTIRKSPLKKILDFECGNILDSVSPQDTELHCSCLVSFPSLPFSIPFLDSLEVSPPIRGRFLFFVLFNQIGNVTQFKVSMQTGNAIHTHQSLQTGNAVRMMQSLLVCMCSLMQRYVTIVLDLMRISPPGCMEGRREGSKLYAACVTEVVVKYSM